MSQDPQTDRPPEFPAPSTSDWQKAAEKSLKGKPLSTLNWDTPEGIVVKPLYTAEDTADLPHTNTLPGFAPYIRGPQATMYAVRLGRSASTLAFRRQPNPTPFTERPWPLAVKG